MTREIRGNNRVNSARHNNPRADDTKQAAMEELTDSSLPDDFDIDSYDPGAAYRVKIPSGIERPGYHYNVGRYTADGEEDGTHERKLEKHYNVVPPSRATYRKKRVNGMQDTMAPFCVKIKDCIIYERPDVFKQKDDEYNEYQSLKQLHGALSKGVMNTHSRDGSYNGGGQPYQIREGW